MQCMLKLKPGIGYNKAKELYRYVLSGIEKNELSGCDFSKIEKIKYEIYLIVWKP